MRSGAGELWTDPGHPPALTPPAAEAMSFDRRAAERALIPCVSGASATLQDMVQREVSRAGPAFTTRQSAALEVLSLHRRTGLPMYLIARSQRIKISTATALVARLDRHGLVRRVADHNDRRVIRVYPTALGLQGLDAYRSARLGTARAVCALFTDAELESLLGLLDRIPPAS